MEKRGEVQNLDIIALLLIVLGIIIIVLGNNIGWALIAIGILKQFWKK